MLTVLKWIGGVVAAFLVVLMVNNWTTPAAVRLKNDLKYDARQTLLSRLKDPDSATIDNEKQGRVTESGRGLYCGTVNAKNGFGGFTGPQRFVVLGGLTVFMEEQQSADKAKFEKLWIDCVYS